MLLKEKLKNYFTPGNLKKAAIVFAGLVFFYILLDIVCMPVYTRQYQSISVPNVTNMPLETAEKVLRQSSLVLFKASEKFDEIVPAGYVMFQNPDPNTPVKSGRRIYLTVSKGHRVFAMPKLIGNSERDARFAIDEQELALGTIDYRSDNFYPDGVVINQSINPGEQVMVGSKVDLVVSLGIEPTVFVVPQLVGKSLQEAVLAVKKAGLTLGKVDEQQTNELLPNTVVSQSLEAGKEVGRGDTVDIVISVLGQNE